MGKNAASSVRVSRANFAFNAATFSGSGASSGTSAYQPQAGNGHAGIAPQLSLSVALLLCEMQVALHAADFFDHDDRTLVRLCGPQPARELGNICAAPTHRVEWRVVTRTLGLP